MGLLTKLSNSVFGLKGSTPATRAGAKADSTIHASALGTDTKYDLDGQTPSKYSDNLPE